MNISIECCICWAQCIDGVSLLSDWSLGHSHTCIPSSGRLHSTDAHQDRHIVRAALAAQTASSEEIWTHVAPAVSPRTIGDYILGAGLGSCVPLARLPLTPRHCQAWLLWCRERVDWRVEWCYVVFSDESRFCLYASDGRTHVRCRPGVHHLSECICPRHTGPTSDYMVRRWPSVATPVTFGVSPG